MNIEHHQPNPEESAPPERPEMLQYTDETTNMAFTRPGQLVEWDSASYMSSPDISPITQALITTEVGSQYLIRGSLALDLSNPNLSQGEGAVDLAALAEEVPDITIGEPAYIPGLGQTPPVDNVLFRYKLGANWGATPVSVSNPFEDEGLEVAYIRARDHLSAPE